MNRRDFVGGYHSDTAAKLEDLSRWVDLMCSRFGPESAPAERAMREYLDVLTKVAEARHDPRDMLDRGLEETSKRRRKRKPTRRKPVRRNVSLSAKAA